MTQQMANDTGDYVPCGGCEECGFLCTHPDRNIFDDCCPLEHEPDCDGCHYTKECPACKGEGGFFPDKEIVVE
jgi:hypothetical protein